MSGHPLPPSMPAGSHEMREYYSKQDPPRLHPHTAPSETPYLGLRARLSQVWINRWTILILLVLARTLLAIQGINDHIASAKREALSACSDVEAMGSAMASMPHYMSTGVNRLTAAGINKSVNGLMSMSTLSVTAVEEIVVFVIGMMTNTYLCLITFAVTGSLRSAIGVVDGAQKDINNLGGKIGGEIGDAMKGFTDAYNAATKVLSGSIIGPTINLPKIPDITKSTDQLKNFKLPPELTADLQKLNSSLPSFAQVKNVTESVIRLPFEEVKKVIDQNLGTYKFNDSLLPVPPKELMTFCSDDEGIEDFFNKLSAMASLAQKIFIGVLVVAAILAMVPMAMREIRRWRHQQERSRLVGDGATDSMDVVYLVSRPYTSSAGLKLAGVPAEPEMIRTATRGQNLTRWAVAYATTDAALFVLCLAIAGLFSCLCQYILLQAIKGKVPELSNQVGAFADKVVAQLTNASDQWQIATNAAIRTASDDINNDMLGWVGTATEAVNNTINVFVDETNKVLDTAFGKTPLRDPIQEVLNCLILLKVQGIQKAMTWVHDNAHINFPTLPNDTFSVGALASLSGDNDQSFLAEPNDKASDKITGAVDRVVSFFESGIRTEAVIASVILALYVFVCLCGIGAAFYRARFNKFKTRGEGGGLSASSGSTTDFRSDDQDRFVNDNQTPAPATEKRQSQFHNDPAPEYEPAAVAKAPLSRHSPDEHHYADSKNPFEDPSSSNEKNGGFI
ncbi:Plasma membrane fusion protein prm1 [Cyphellophora attinorum]|uniref:Plasma membrane fusion protein PRM1 n=1 Tax=Cyphellophora attinorum TaxID=1664694 RepID=A0A0N1P0P0_9EURO|nr:Plasma membrane fusion protein prm1 [Phialophora attinorum]KPI40715.1 Plasma membrane fusion protein prm1 [Phialophora attinorum]